MERAFMLWVEKIHALQLHASSRTLLVNQSSGLESRCMALIRKDCNDKVCRALSQCAHGMMTHLTARTLPWLWLILLRTTPVDISETVNIRKKLFFQALQGCGWNKELWMHALGPGKEMLRTKRDSQELLEMLTNQGFHIRKIEDL